MDSQANSRGAAGHETARLRREVADLKKRLAAMRRSEEQYRLVADHCGDCLWMMELATLRFTYVSPAAMQLYGATPEETVGKGLAEVLPPQSQETAAKVLAEELAAEAAGTADPKRIRTVEIEEYRQDGSLIWVESVLSFQRDDGGQPVAIIGVSRDVTERRRLREELRALAITDPLTGAFNRRHFQEVLGWEIQRSSRYPSSFSLIMIDIDHFKAVNDRFGHLTGDRVLVELADLLRQRIRSADLLVRWGGEEFLIMLAHTDLGQAIPLTEELRGIVESHVFPEIGRMTVSAGVTQYRGQESVDALLTRVDDLMYQAKGKGRNRVAHDGPQNGRLFET